jgi:predicted Rdx family selenoprotein
MGRKNRTFREVAYSTIKEDTNLIDAIDISKDDDPSLVEERLQILLEKNIEGKPNLILGILIGINEVVDNILEHSDGTAFKEYDRSVENPGLVSIEYCNKSSYLHITIWDFGKGIVDTLAKEYTELSREEVLYKAFELNVTRHRKIWESRGNGLAKLKEFVLKSDGSILCETNEFEIIFNPLHPRGYVKKAIEEIKGTQFTITIGCSNELNIYPIFETDAFEYFFDWEDNSIFFNLKEFIPLNSHQVGIKIKKMIKDNLEDNNKLIVLNFSEVEVFTDSFIQQVTTKLSEEVGFKNFKARIRFKIFNNLLLNMVQEKIYMASKTDE